MMKNIVLFFLLFSTLNYAQESADEKTNKKRNVFFDISGGYGGRIGETAGENDLERKHSQSQKSGFSYDVSLYFRLFDNKNSFIGFKYNAFNKKSVIDDAYVTAPNGQQGYGEFSDNVTISFYGISYMYSKPTASRDEFSFDVGLGYIGYKDKAVYLQDYKIKGASFGVYTSGSYYLRISDGFSLGPRVGLLLGTLSSVKIEGPNNYREDVKLDDNMKESLSRIDLSIGARIKF